MNSKQQNRECQGTLVSQVQSRACQPFGALLDLIISGQDERTLATDHEPNTNTTTTYADSWDRRTDRLDTEDQGKEKQTGTKAAGIGFQRNPRSADHKNASFSSSFSTSSWLFSLATSMGVFPSKFWRVLRARGGGGGGQSRGGGTIAYYNGEQSVCQGAINLHSSPVLEQEHNALLTAIASGKVKGGVLVLVQRVNHRPCLKKNLSTFHLKQKHHPKLRSTQKPKILLSPPTRTCILRDKK